MVHLDRSCDDAQPEKKSRHFHPSLAVYDLNAALNFEAHVLPDGVRLPSLVLFLGLVNMTRGGSPNLSQKLMRWRVILQFVAVVIAMAAIWAMGR